MVLFIQFQNNFLCSSFFFFILPKKHLEQSNTMIANNTEFCFPIFTEKKKIEKIQSTEPERHFCALIVYFNQDDVGPSFYLILSLHFHAEGTRWCTWPLDFACVFVGFSIWKYDLYFPFVKLHKLLSLKWALKCSLFLFAIFILF